MATNKVIKGLTVQIGGDTTQLGKALDNIDKKSRALSTELGQINKLLKFDPGNADLLAQKQKVLADAVSTTKQKLDTLREAEKQVQAQFAKGEASEEQVRALKREIIEAEKKLSGYESAAKETAEAIERLGEGAEDAAKDVDDLADKQKEAERSAEDLGDELGGGLSAGLKAVAGLAAAASAAVVGIVESTKEYRTEMGKLDAAFESSGHSTETAKEAYKELNSIIGETDQSVEAAQQIALLADSHEEVAKWADLAAGVVGKFGDALQPETFYEAANETLKLGEATGAYTQMLEGVGMNVEDFNEELAKCNTTEKKQALLLKTTEKALGSARDAYKKNNKAIIEANKASEEWNDTLADIGDEMQPVVTDIKKMGTELLKSAKEPLKDVASFVSDKLIPALTSISKWVLGNLPLIKAGLVGFTTAFVAYKVAVIATEVAQKGLVGAIQATTVAQKALNLVQKATPWGLVAAGVAGLVTTIVALTSSSKEAKEEVYTLTEEEKKVREAAEQAAEAFDAQREATNNSIGSLQSNMSYVSDLADELQGLADANGRVQESDETRVQFILNELNEALGTEYKMVDGVIQKYGDLKDNIDLLIQSKSANAMLEFKSTDYVMALDAANNAFADFQSKQSEYYALLDDQQLKEAEYLAAKKDYESKKAYYASETSRHVAEEAYGELLATEQALENAKKKTEGFKEEYDKSATNYYNHYDTIQTYREAEEAAIEGNYQKVIELLSGESAAFVEYTDGIDEQAKRELDILYKKAFDMGLAASEAREKFRKGMDGYTEDTVKEAEQGYADAFKEWENAYRDAVSVGEDLGEGASQGLDNTTSTFIIRARAMMANAIAAMRAEADSNSPSKETMSLGEDMGAGAKIGLEKSTDDVVTAAEKQVKGVLDAYSDASDQSTQALFRSIDSRRSARQTESFAAMTDGTSSKLDKILAAIERGQILTIDGEKFVGGTYDTYDKKLGQKRNLVARGAL